MEAVTVLGDHVTYETPLPEAEQGHVGDGRVGRGEIMLPVCQRGDHSQLKDLYVREGTRVS